MDLKKVENASVTAPKDFHLSPCTEYYCTVADGGSSGAAQIQVFAGGTSWVDVPDSDGTGAQAFIFVTPPTGRVRVNRSAGTVLVSFAPMAPSRIKNA